jgi:phage gpG-like protein
MIEVTTDTVAFDSSLRDLQRRMGDLRPVFKELGAVLENKIRDRRETLKDPDGKPWAPWAASTVANYPWPNRRNERGQFVKGSGRGKLLDRTGAMWDKPGPEWQLKGSGPGLELRVGFAELYATYHEFGTRTMPRRGLLYSDPDNGTLGADDVQSIQDILTDWLNAQTR